MEEGQGKPVEAMARMPDLTGRGDAGFSGEQVLRIQDEDCFLGQERVDLDACRPPGTCLSAHQHPARGEARGPRNPPDATVSLVLCLHLWAHPIHHLLHKHHHNAVTGLLLPDIWLGTSFLKVFDSSNQANSFSYTNGFTTHACHHPSSFLSPV